MTLTLFCRWLALLALLSSLPFSRGCDCGESTPTPQKAERPEQSDVPLVLVHSDSLAETNSLLNRAANKVRNEFTDLREDIDLESGHFQLWAPQAISAKVKARLAVLVAEETKLAEEEARLIPQVAVYPLDGLDLETTAADLTQQFRDIKVNIDLHSRSLVIRAIGKTQLAIKARVDKLEKQNSQGKVHPEGS